MMGTTLIGPDAQPSMTRVFMLRLPSHEPEPRLLSEEAYLPAGSAISADLAALGYKAGDPLELDRCMVDLLKSGVGGIGVDQVPATARLLMCWTAPGSPVASAFPREASRSGRCLATGWAAPQSPRPNLMIHRSSP